MEFQKDLWFSDRESIWYQSINPKCLLEAFPESLEIFIEVVELLLNPCSSFYCFKRYSMQPQKQKMTFNTIRNMQFRNVAEFAEIPSFRAMAKMNKFSRVSRMEVLFKICSKM